MKLHSQIVAYILFGLLIVSCATSPVSVTSTIIIPSETPQPTQTLTETLTLTPTATEVTPALASVGWTDSQYPEAGPKPDMTATDITLDPITNTYEWSKANPEHADRPLYYKAIQRDNGEVKKGWFWLAGSTNLADQPDLGKILTMKINFWAEEKSDCPIITHPPTVATGVTFTALLEEQIKIRMGADETTFVSEFVNGTNGVDLPFTTVNGNPHIYNTNANINLYIVNTLDNPDSTVDTQHFSIGGDDEKDLNIIVQPLTPMSAMSDEEISDTLFFPVFIPLDINNLSHKAFMGTSNPMTVDKLLEMTIRGPNPYFVYVR